MATRQCQHLLLSDEAVTQLSNVAIHGQTLEVHVSFAQDGRARGFVASSTLDTDETVLDNVDTADTVLASELVESQEDFDRVRNGCAFGGHLGFGTSGVDQELNRDTLLKGDRQSFRLRRGFLEALDELPHVIGRGRIGVLEDTSLVRDVEQVLVWRR